MNNSLYEKGYIYKFKDGDLSLERKPIVYQTSLSEVYHVVREGQSLIDIAVERYNNPFLWYIIADTNIIDDIFNLTVNSTLLIPNPDNIRLLYG